MKVLLALLLTLVPPPSTRAIYRCPECYGTGCDVQFCNPLIWDGYDYCNCWMCDGRGTIDFRPTEEPIYVPIHKRSQSPR